MTAPKIAIVTGAGGGIGGATAAAFRRRGWDLIGLRRTPAPSADDLTWVCADLARADGSHAAAAAIAGALAGRRADALVHCAAVHREGTPLSPDACELMTRVNLVAPYLLCELLRPHLAAPSTIVLVSSIAAARAKPGTELYGATKAGVEALVGSLAFRLGSAGIRVVGVAPGLVRTKMARAAYSDPAHIAALARANPTGRNGEPDDVAELIYALTAPEARWATGVVVRADGGAALGFGQPVWDGDRPAAGFADPPSSPSQEHAT